MQEAGLGKERRRIRVFVTGPVPFGSTGERFLWNVENVFPTQNLYVRIAHS